MRVLVEIEEVVITPAEALVLYHRAVEKVRDALAARDEAWAVYQRARDEQARRLPQG